MKSIFEKLSKRERYILYTCLAIVSLVIFDRIVLTPVRRKLNKLSIEIPLEEQRLKRALYTLSRQDLISEQHQKLTRALKQRLADEEERSQLLSEIEKLARKSEVVLRDIKPGLIKPAELCKRYTVEIEAEAKIDGLIDFIYQLERTPALLRVNNFRLVPKEKLSAVLKVRMTISQELIAAE
ncbi:type 4a pilus biogenesis protein PilO [Candidatus Omnitrophota bacterium]